MVIVLFSCNTDKQMLVGFWVVEEAYVKNNGEKINLGYNGLYFNDNGHCELPVIFTDYYISKANANWELVEEGKQHFAIITPNDNAESSKYFSGKYTYYFFNDPVRRLHKMQLESDRVKMICSRFLTRY